APLRDFHGSLGRAFGDGTACRGCGAVISPRARHRFRLKLSGAWRVYSRVPIPRRRIVHLDRRHVLIVLAGAVTTPALAEGIKTEAPMSRLTAYAFSFARLDGGDIRLADFASKPILVVNTASLCGYTPQYAGLQDLWTRFHDRGLMILGVPSNDFGGQEPGT